MQRIMLRMQWMMLRLDKQEDFVIAIGGQYSVRQFVEWSTAELGIEINFEGSEKSKIGIVSFVDKKKSPPAKVGV